MANYGNLRDASILQDFVVFLNGVGKIGTVANISLPELNVQTEEFRGGGMDMPVQIPMGLEKMELSFDLLSWDDDTWSMVGYDKTAMTSYLQFYGYTFTANGKEVAVEIDVWGGITSVKNDQIAPGKNSKQTVKMAVHKYIHKIGDNTVANIDAFGKGFSGKVDNTATARQMLQIPSNQSTTNTVSASSGLIGA